MLCNGSQGIVVRFTHDGLPVIRFSRANSTNSSSGFEIPMTYHIWPSETIPGVGVSQLPIILAWALTIHKAQGATLDIAEIDAGSSIFECGQTYVALSRVKSLEGLYLTSYDVKKIRVNKKVQEFYQLITNTTTITTDQKVEEKVEEVEKVEKVEEIEKVEKVEKVEEKNELIKTIKLFNLSEYEYKN
jgi:ATP-dependent exoDNAse (exonuclease V) alpha subunit